MAHPHPSSARRGLALFGRALRLRCPNCGGARVFSGWFTMLKDCPSCGLHLERNEQGYIVGAYMFNVAVAELIWLVLFLAVIRLTWPNPPWTPITYIGMAMMVALPIFFYPFSKTLFLAFDLFFRPSGSE